MRGLGKIALTLVAILAYRNRDKLSEWLKAGRQRRADKGPDIEHPDDAGTIERLIDGLGSGDGIAEILDQFRNAGAEESVESWIGNGPNRPLPPEEVRAAIGDDTLGALSLQTGLAEEELLNRIARELPPTIDRMTPSGSLLATAESSSIEDHIKGELGGDLPPPK